MSLKNIYINEDEEEGNPLSLQYLEIRTKRNIFSMHPAQTEQQILPYSN